MVEIISVDNESRWDEVIRSMHKYDFYHLAPYHKLDESGEAFLLYYSNEGNAFAFPFIKRKIPNTDYFDITSVYGYGGPLAMTESPLHKDISAFQTALKGYFDHNNIVTVFSSLHPLFTDQSLLLDGLGDVADVNKTVAINLCLSESQQRGQYARSVKYRINRLKKEGIVIKLASEKKDVDSFIEIYKENMDRVAAASKYYFSKDYFYAFLKKIDSEILLAYHENEVISGSLCTFCNSIMQAHLNATKTDFLDISPLKLVLDQARREGMQRKMNWLHLGGGRDGENDSLFDFKSRFSHDHFLFKVWRYIHNEKMYSVLLKEKYKGNLPNTSFFPLYRM